jgi:hypothetical protein
MPPLPPPPPSQGGTGSQYEFMGQWKETVVVTEPILLADVISAAEGDLEAEDEWREFTGGGASANVEWYGTNYLQLSQCRYQWHAPTTLGNNVTYVWYEVYTPYYDDPDTTVDERIANRVWNRKTWTATASSESPVFDLPMWGPDKRDSGRWAVARPMVEVVTWGSDIDDEKESRDILVHAQAPSIKLNAVNNGSVTVSGGMASITLSGEITDAIMSTMPAGKGADITRVRTYVNGEPSENEVAVVRESTEEAFWAPYGCKGKFQNLEVSFPASGIQRLTVETEANAAGIHGKVDVEVVFERQFLPVIPIQGQSKTYELELPASLSDQMVDLVQCTDPITTLSLSLTETDADSRLFVSADGTVQLWLSQYELTSNADDLDCVLMAPGLPAAGGSLSSDTTCQETTPTSLRFAYTVTTANSQMSGGFTDTLESVKIVDNDYPASGFPFALRARGDLGEDAQARWLGQDFPLDKPENSEASYVSTAIDKPLIGFLVSTIDEANSGGLEFLYYDEDTAQLKRVSRDINLSQESLSLKTAAEGGVQSEPLDLPLRHLRLLDPDGAPSGGYIPVNIDALIAISEGNTFVEISEDSQMILEVSGGRPGEIVRVFSDEVPDDEFELIVPGEEPAEAPGPRSATLVTVGEGVYRTEQKVVVYSTAPEDPQQLTDAQWQTLKAMGFLAVHNDNPVVRMALNDLVPPEGATPPNLIPGSRDPKDYRFPGCADHHVINVYHGNKPKAKKWKNMLIAMFGDDFDPDAFTIPLKKSVHDTRQYLSTDVWDKFIVEIEPNFDADGKLIGSVNAETVADMRANTLLNMKKSLGAMVGSENVDACMGRMRIWPTVLRGSPLKEAFLKEGYKMGSSANRFSKFCMIAGKGLQDASKLASLKNLSKSVLKSAMKHGAKVVLLSLLSIVTKTYAIVDTGIDITQYGWQEALAIRINQELDLNDMDLARQVVAQTMTTDTIPGGTRAEALTLRNGQVVRQNDFTFRCYWDPQGRITHVDTFIVTEIKANFSNGDRPRLALKRLDSTDYTIVIDDPPWVIQDWWPHKGASAFSYHEAQWRAMQH